VSEFEIGIRATMDREESKKTSERMTAVRARELWHQRGIEFQRLLVEAVLEPITVKPAGVRGRKRFDPERLVLVPRT
jgi:hypothetical protein